MKLGENSPSGLEDRDSGCCIQSTVTRQLNVRPPIFSAQSPEPTSTAAHGGELARSTHKIRSFAHDAKEIARSGQPSRSRE